MFLTEGRRKKGKGKDATTNRVRKGVCGGGMEERVEMGVLLGVFAVLYKVRETVNTQVLARNKLTGCRVVILRATKKIKEFVRVVWWFLVGSGWWRTRVARSVVTTDLNSLCG